MPTPSTAAAHATGRQRGDGSDPSGKTNASASGHRKITGHGAETVAAHSPSVVSPSCSATALAIITIVTDSDPDQQDPRHEVPGPPQRDEQPHDRRREDPDHHERDEDRGHGAILSDSARRAYGATTENLKGSDPFRLWA